MTYREPLPDGCPPADSDEILSPRPVYRIVRTTPPMLDDFQSQRAEKPKAPFSASECQA